MGQLSIVDHENNVGGGETYYKHDDHKHSHDDCSSLLRTVLHVGCSQGLDYSHIADHCEDQRDEEEDGSIDREKIKIIGLELLCVLHVVAGGDAQIW